MGDLSCGELSQFHGERAHGPPSGPVCPALHLQSVEELLAFHDVECAGHAAHVLEVSAAVAAEYVPRWQDVHAADPRISL